MYLFHRSSDIIHYLKAMHQPDRNIGLVPVSRDLHDGHIALIKHSLKMNTCTICAILCGIDMENGTDSLGKDIDLLASLEVDALFLPPREKLFPAQEDAASDWDFGLLDQVMEGEFRLGHFAELATTIKRLLDIVQPQTLLWGQKNFQECIIIRRLLEQTHSQVRLTICPIIREADGLAFSDQNQHLTTENRAKASVIFETLQAGKDMLDDFPPEEIERFALGQLASYGFRPEYFEIVDGNNLEPVENPATAPFIVACTAVWAGEVRLTDNMIWKAV